MSKHTDGNQPLSIRRRHLNGYQWYVFVMLTIGALFMLFPFVWMILSAFKTKADVYAYPPRWIPSEWKWENFAKVFEMIPFWRYYFNSIVTSVIETVLQVASLGWLDSYAGIIFPQVTTAFTTLLLMSYFDSIPKDLVDSAKLDGCGYFRVLTRVIVPNSKGAISTATLFSFLGNWKSYTWPLIVTTKTEYRTLPIGLKYLMQESSSEYQVMMAASLMAILPVLVIFIFCEKQLVRSITLTGMKS